MGMSKEVSQQRRSILIRAFKQHPDWTGAEACAKVEEKFPGMGTPTSAIVADCRREAAKRQRAPKEVRVSGERRVSDDLRRGTTQVPGVVTDFCRAKLKPLLQEYNIEAFSIRDGKIHVRIGVESEAEL
jgi:hypothetical protein